MRKHEDPLAQCAVSSYPAGSTCCARYFVFLRKQTRFLAAGVHLSAQPRPTPLTGFANGKFKNINARDGRIGYRRFWAPFAIQTCRFLRTVRPANPAEASDKPAFGCQRTRIHVPIAIHVVVDLGRATEHARVQEDHESDLLKLGTIIFTIAVRLLQHIQHQLANEHFADRG
ncbi:hypothetical protein PWP93_16655 [Paraburkholderia sp. A1RI-2L]|uniref:hypothetical protein n=1 Tax=Paraburkholderia sp. A1RI-2L TaxID=3028367 RepID=UPI003B82BF48